MNRDERFALMDPETGEKEWLPDPPGAGDQTWAIELSASRLAIMRFEMGGGTGMSSRPALDLFDRSTSSWTTIAWPTLPASENPSFATIGPDGRAYVALVTDPGDVPEGGWPMGRDGDADDADAEGDVRALWSMSLTDSADVRFEDLAVGSFDFTDDALVWTDSTNGAAGRVHLRDLATGEETSFDPSLGERCNLLGFDAEGDHIAMTQYCGTYDDGVRDDRVQVVTTGGEQVVTVQDSGVDGGQLVAGGDFLTLTAYGRATGGTYLYDFGAERLLRLSDGMSSWAAARGPVPGDQFLWTEPAGRSVATFGRSGAESHLSEIIR